jgi:hypothetical protein
LHLPSNHFVKLSIYNYRDLNFVELNTTGTEKVYKKCDSDSRYLDTAVFNLFTECFEKSNNLYEYFDATKYNSRNIIPLRNQLLTHLTGIEKIKDLEDFQVFIEEKSFGKAFLLALVQKDKTWCDHWSVYHQKLIKINRKLLELVDFIIDEDRLLWVIGY